MTVSPCKDDKNIRNILFQDSIGDLLKFTIDDKYLVGIHIVIVILVSIH